ncbi:UNVERIFIED_CONTAM: hypothetical protein ABID98_004454 [Brevibacillus sp. OAP136]
MMLDAKDVFLFPLRLVGIVKASAPLFPENPFAADGIILFPNDILREKKKKPLDTHRSIQRVFRFISSLLI